MKKPKVVVLSGAGISAGSGLKTFRDHDGLWEGYRVEEVATPEAWHQNKDLVQKFYNERRKAVLDAKPNEAHIGIAALQKDFDVIVITQNIDDLHERAGSQHILHLHGEIRKARSVTDSDEIYLIHGDELTDSQVDSKGQPLRPFVVWFGEPVPAIETAIQLCSDADALVVVGTSLQVYPAASLINYVPEHAKVFVLDIKRPAMKAHQEYIFIETDAINGVTKLTNLLKKELLSDEI